MIGHRDAVRCLDLTLAQMRPGDVFRIFCPSQLVYGQIATYGFFDDEIIPSDTNLKYTVEMIACYDES